MFGKAVVLKRRQINNQRNRITREITRKRIVVTTTRTTTQITAIRATQATNSPFNRGLPGEGLTGEAEAEGMADVAEGNRPVDCTQVRPHCL